MKNKLGKKLLAKKLLALILSTSLLFSVISSLPVFAASEVNGILTNNNGTIYDCDSKGENRGTTQIASKDVTHLFIASDVEKTLPVVPERLFINLVSLTIPPTLRVIENTFGNSPKLENIDFSNATGLEEIIGGAFAYCFSLKTVDLSKATNLKAFIGSNNTSTCAFQQCFNLETVILPKNLKELGRQTFDGCSKLADVTFLSKTPPTTGKQTFDSTKDQIRFHLPTGSNVNEWEAALSKTGLINPVFIADNKYGIYKNDGNVYECDENAVATATIADKTAITNLFISDDVTEIKDKAFSQCSKLVNVDFSNAINLKTIGVSAFAYCQNLETMTPFPQSVTTINANAFENCRNLESVNLINATNLISIGNTAFSGCESLKTMEIPDSVTSIGEFVFGTCKSLLSVTLPKDITKIGKSMFFGCEKLGSIEIPHNVTAIDNYAFYNCQSLSNVRFSAEQPPIFGTTPFASTKDGINVFLNNGASENIWQEKLLEAGMKNPKFIIDITPPTAEIKIGDAIFNSAITDITFKTLLKDNQKITITASDTASAISKIEYQDVETAGDFDANGLWKTYTDAFEAEHLGANIIYARATDLAGNQTIINTNGFIVYADSKLQTELTEFDRKEENQRDVFVRIILNGNTLKSITNGETVLEEGTDYIIEPISPQNNFADYPESSSLILHIKKSYLAKLPSGIQTLTFNFDPSGIVCGLVINTPLEITIKDTGHVHEYDTEFTIDKAATCTEEGEKSRHCKGYALCGDKAEITKIDLAPHTGGVANCHMQAICSVCNRAYGEKDLHNHDGGTELRNAKPATHKEDGNLGDTCCKGCDAVLKAGEVVPKISHTHDGKWQHDEKSHWHNCTGCDEKLDNAEHTWATEASLLASYTSNAATLDYLKKNYDKTNKTEFKNPIYYFCTFCYEVKKEEFNANGEFIAMKIGDGLVHTIGTSDGATFVSVADIKDFLKVSIDGMQIKLSDIKLKAGSTIVTISSEYMDTLPNGQHTVEIYSTTGTATAKFTVVGNKEKPTTPETPTIPTTPETPTTPENPETPTSPTNPNTENPTTPEIPKTSNGETMPRWIGLMFVSSGALMILEIGKKRRKLDEK